MKRICFVYKGKRYEMTEDEIEAAYRLRERQYRYEDARRQFLVFVFGDDPINVSVSDQTTAIHSFTRKYGIGLAEGLNLLDEIVARFEKDFDCNQDENTAWENAIEAVLSGRA